MKLTNRHHVVAIAATPVLAAAALVQSAQPSKIAGAFSSFVSPGPAIDVCIEPMMSAYRIPGLAVAVVVDGEIAYERGYGVKHRRQGGAVDEYTLFRHGSVGKMLTAGGVLRLVDRGEVDLDDPVTEYIPELHFAPGRWSSDQIKVRHLINNTAAVPSYRSATDASPSEWAATLREIPLLAKPGAFFNYSNSNFALADLVIERASGMDFADFMAAEVYRPAGMSDTTRDSSEAAASGNFSYGYTDDGQVYAPDDYRQTVDGFTSAHDLAVWAQLMMSGGGEVLSRKSAEMAQSPQAPMYHNSGRPTSIDGGHYGFGLFIDEYPSGTVIGHGGGMPGWVTRVAWVRSKEIAVVMLANSWPNAHTGVSDATACILESLVGVTTPDMAVPSDPATWSPYTGTYDAIFDDGYEFEVTVEFKDGELLMTVPNPQNSSEMITRALESLHDSTFRFWENANNWWDMTFIRGEGNPAPVRWLRNLRFAGLKRVEPRRSNGRVGP